MGYNYAKTRSKRTRLTVSQVLNALRKCVKQVTIKVGLHAHIESVRIKREARGYLRLRLLLPLPKEF